MSNRREGKIINLIMFDHSNGGHHYALIKNFDRLLSSGRGHVKKFCPFVVMALEKTA